MPTIESLAHEIERLEACAGDDRHAYTVAPQRLHLARGPRDSVELFIEGERASFGLAAVGRSLEWGHFRDLGGPREFSALVVRASEGFGSTRLMAHLAYEALQIVIKDPSVTNARLLELLSPFVSLVIQRLLLSPHHQMGLTGELLLLLELLNFADRHEPPIDKMRGLDAWKGWDSASRDFSGPEVAVEVKATSHDVRRHVIQPMYQVLPDPHRASERVYLYSVGLKPDRSHSFRLLTAFDRVYERLDSDQASTFVTRLGQYGGSGFDRELRSHYELEVGFSVIHPPGLFRVDNLSDILRPEAFVGGLPPNRAKRITYELSLEGLSPCSDGEREFVLRGLLGQRQRGS